ncbi:helix-turn-helix domain-containing protein [Peribacillus simplex]|uniref:helix-turn-helix domain-containing protein n=1 Tax=Peribacillus simplex TaxID=1478 RepID=UPI00367155A0
MELGHKLKSLRKKHGYSQHQLADQLNVTPQAISKWENDKSVPDIMNLVQLSEVYDVSLDYLIKADKDLQRKLSINKAQLNVFKYFIISIILVLCLVILLLTKAQFFMFQHGMGTYIFLGFIVIFIISILSTIYMYVIKKNYLIFFWISFLALGFIVFLGFFYEYIMDLLFI